MRLLIRPGVPEVAEAAADLIEERLRSGLRVLGLATGSTPVPTYTELIRRHRAGRVSFSGVRAFLLDEYIGLPDGHPECYREVIRRDFTAHVDFDDDAVRSPDAWSADPDAAAAEYDAEIRAAGGVDLQVLGIGRDGHIGFNEPGTPLDSRTHVTDLADETVVDNSRFFGGVRDSVPTRALTQGVGTIREARSLLLVVTGAAKATVLANALRGEIAPGCPASVVRDHPDAVVICDEAAAAGLDRTPD